MTFSLSPGISISSVLRYFLSTLVTIGQRRLRASPPSFHYIMNVWLISLLEERVHLVAEQSRSCWWTRHMMSLHFLHWCSSHQLGRCLWLRECWWCKNNPLMTPSLKMKIILNNVWNALSWKTVKWAKNGRNQGSHNILNVSLILK